MKCYTFALFTLLGYNFTFLCKYIPGIGKRRKVLQNEKLLLLEKCYTYSENGKKGILQPIYENFGG